VLSSSPPKSSNMDLCPMSLLPTSLIIRCKSVFGDIIAHLANLSFSEDRFPAKFKQASVTPLLKGCSLDKSAPSSYRPISNLNFISKDYSWLVFRPTFWRLQTSTNINLPIEQVVLLRLPYSCLWIGFFPHLTKAD